MITSWISIIPPLIVIFSVFITKKINQSLIAGIIAAGLFATHFSLIASSRLILTRTYEVLTDIDTLLLYVFLGILGAIITLIAQTGGAYAFAHTLEEKHLSKKTAEYSSMLISFLLAIDDYLSTLTVGYVMRPITDRLAISRARLAFLIHAMANGLIMLLPISSWVTALTSTLDQAGISDHGTSAKIVADPFLLYVQTIPYIFYGILIVSVVALVIHSQLYFGPMASFTTPITHNDTLQTVTAQANKRGALSDLILPLLLLIGTIIVSSLWIGGYSLFGGQYNFLEALKNNSQRERSLIMSLAGCLSLVISWLFAVVRKKIDQKSISKLFVGSFELMKSAIILITLAGILGAILRIDLQTGTYLANILLGSLPLFLLPLIVFLVALILAAITGSAFGSMMLLIPIIVPMLISLSGVTTPANPALIPLLLPVLGAVFSGAVCGNHISPISDTTIMVATSTSITPADHARTQIPYVLIAVCASALSFLVTGILSNTSYWINACVSSGAGLILCFMLIYALRFTQHKNSENL